MLLPTKDRPEKLRVALESVASQSRLPDLVLVVREPDAQDETAIRNAIRNLSPGIPVECIINKRTANLSGAINSALVELLARGLCPETTYVSMLDDDDYWDPEYVEVCLSAGAASDSDWVVTGIVRYESEHGPGVKLTVPETLSVDDFLVTNPHIQGSNLFVRFSTLLMAGGLDESLQSTTDRDVCIRLLDLAIIRYECVNRHLVHHMALPASNRLSEPGSEPKRSGLNSFYKKYYKRMTSEQRDLFKRRAASLFGIDIQDGARTETERSPKRITRCCSSGVIPIIVGVVVTKPDSFESLLDDLLRVQSELEIINRVVAVDCCESTNRLMSLVSETRYSPLRIKLKASSEVAQASKDGLFGECVEEQNIRRSIAFGRTILHHYLHEEAMTVPGSVVWVIDDDVRLEKLLDSGVTEPIGAADVQDEVLRLKEAGVSIGIVQCTGDAPITPLGTIRTQLLDLLHILKENESNAGFQPDRTSYDNGAIRRLYPEYYYDYSMLHSGHLESPMWFRVDSATYTEDTIIERALGILDGKSVFRPIVYAEADASAVNTDNFQPVGVSYFIANPNCLREFPVLSPRVAEASARRGDTFWGVLNSRIGNYTVSPCSLAVRHVRVANATSLNSLQSLLLDFVGSSFTRAIDAFYREKGFRVGTLPDRIGLALTDTEIDEITHRYLVFLRQRLLQLTFNAYRIRGLLSSLRKTVVFSRSKNLSKLVETLESVFSESAVESFVREAESLGTPGVETLLRELKELVKNYRHRLKLDYGEAHIARSKAVVTRILGIGPLEFVGVGNEGTVLTDGQHAYKHFHHGALAFEKGQMRFLKDKVLGRLISEHIVRLEEIIEKEGEIIFKTRFVQGSDYGGGNAESFVSMIKDCRRAGVVHTNIHPKNLVSTECGAVLCDVGRSVFPLNDKELKHMARRAYLTLRFHFRDDLSEIMSEALYDDRSPYLMGFEHFYAGLQESRKSDVLDGRVVSLVLDGNPRNVIDFGCGNGSITEKIAAKVRDVVGYDVDEGLIRANKKAGLKATYMGPSELRPLIGSRKFDYGLCSLVLCTLEDDYIFDGVLADLRSLVRDDGRVLVAMCNPFFSSVSKSETHIKLQPREDGHYWTKSVYTKKILETGRARQDVHRPFGSYEHAFHRHGFQVENLSEVKNIDTADFLPSSDFLLAELKPIAIPREHRVSLLIKASPLEWQTIEFQMRHIVKQLEGPQSFIEKIVVTDMHPGPFLRQYCEPNQDEFDRVLRILLNEGIIDKVIYAPLDPESVSALHQRWFNIGTTETHSHNGQHTYTSLYGLEQCSGDYILQMDSDCLVYRKDRGQDYLSDMISVFETDPDALTVSFNAPTMEDRPYTSEFSDTKWRVEVRFSILDRERLRKALPLPNSIGPDGKLVDSWHRALDKKMASSKWKSYRGGSAKTFYVHVPNSRKTDRTGWYNITRSVERGRIPHAQYNSIDAVGLIGDWVGKRDEELIVLVRGRDVPMPKLRRCIDSLEAQTGVQPGIVLIDAGSKNGMDEYLQSVVLREVGDRSSLLLNWDSSTAIENIVTATQSICSNEDSIIIHVDADDALIGNTALERIEHEYTEGADVTVGSMLRTDKQRDYPVDFEDPRRNRGGNVWQHPRSFRKRLFDFIDTSDFKIDGEWIDVAEDWAFMLPIVEMAKKPVMIPDILYLHEPYRLKTEEFRKYRESVIAQIVTKRSYAEMKHKRSNAECFEEQ